MRKILLLMLTTVLLLCSCGGIAMEDGEDLADGNSGRGSVVSEAAVSGSAVDTEKEDQTENGDDKVGINVTADEKAGYPISSPGYYQRYVCADKEWIYLAQNGGEDRGCKIIRLRKDGTDVKTIYENESGKIFCVNAVNGWVVFQLVEPEKTWDNYYIVKVGSDGTKCKKFEARVQQLRMYGDKIWYSDFSKWGGKNIKYLEMAGEGNGTVFEDIETPAGEGIDFTVANGKIYMFHTFGDTAYESMTCELSQMSLQGDEVKKIMELDEVYSICLWGNSVFFLNEQEQLCRREIGGGQTEKLASEVGEYFIEGQWIYFTTDDAGPAKLCKVNVDGGGVVEIQEVDRMIDGILDGKIYFHSTESDQELIRMDCGSEQMEKIPLG